MEIKICANSVSIPVIPVLLLLLVLLLVLLIVNIPHGHSKLNVQQQ